ncbi:MAG TPA: MFS transporter, partial [Candidatus Synoicihabitans sp.]|nr:MFS transporter [Candidatus Synoicihabitans sp.]
MSFWEKTALGAGHLPLFLGYAAVNSFAVPVYQMTLQLDPALLALALAIPRFWDAMTDPAMGVISDNTHSRWGRRRPYIVIGAILQGLAFGLIWMVPGSWGQGATAAWLVVTLLLFYSCFTVYSVPLYSLTYEMTPDYQERTRVAAFSGFFDKSGEFVYQWIFPLTQLALFSSVLMGVRTVG